ncbi:putative NLR family CARD domain-containing protein 4 [Apostichopus japonicus]|uniref:Putative NLR family CARD domain-containing protein 4 n=1 Tax=Stichopus japonicus TaxID=307972 RepID=A0A2G8JUB7_STIJA|nr:putative NLR family CARD domain-containing protein 4 [Apostichopus japonicus]
MFSLKLIQEWCENDEKSSLKGVEVVIFFRVNELTAFSSLYDAIKSVLLPMDSNISSTDIEKVLKNCQSVVIILDDYEERHQKLVWLTNILKKKTLLQCKVVITTRSFEFVKSIVVSSKRFRLTAFSEETRKEYIYNYVGKKGKKFVEQVKTELLENVILNELCKIPLLLVAYIHLICEPKYNYESKSSISIFCYLLKCVELHHQNKARHQADASISSETEALEQEKVIALSTDQEDMEKTELLNQICFLPSFASYFTDILDTFISCYSDMEIPATWLKYEQTRKLSTIRDSLTKFCSEHVEITTCEYPLLRRSKIELLKLASKNKIPIKDVSFTNCVDVELSTKDMLVITSGMEIPLLVTVKKITFEGKQTKLTNEESELMLMYCNHCSHLETVQFRRLTMPGSLKNCTKFLRKEITVLWNSADGKEFVLQMQSGLWNDLQLKNTQRKKKHLSLNW